LAKTVPAVWRLVLCLYFRCFT